MDLTGQALLWPRPAMPSINSCGGIPDFRVSITTCVFSTSASQSLESYSWTYFASGRSTRPFGRSERQRLNVNSSLRSEEHTSELQSLRHLVCRLLLEKKSIM